MRKKSMLFTVAVWSSFSVFSQTNTFPATGNAGIGTLTPRSKLEVRLSDAYINSIRVGIGGRAGDSTFDNTCLGKEALQNTFDIFVPAESLPWAGRYNTAIGRAALRDNFEGGYNTAVGAYALAEGGYDGNTAVGFSSLTNNHGTFNSALGMNSLWLNDGGDYNAAFGYESLASNSNGNSNTAVGHSSLYRNTTANYNTAVGSYCMYQNTTGTLNTAIGYRSLDSNSTGSGNTATGIDALFRNKTGSGNTATGSYALNGLNSANYNTAVGRYALINTVTGGTNTAVGYYASPSTGALSNTTALGYNARPTASNQVRIGNSAVTSIGGYANWTNVSDARVKRNIKENVPGLDFINQLTPVTYNLNLEGADKIMNDFPASNTDMEKNDMEEHSASRLAKQKIVYSGFIAQDVEKAAKKIAYDFSGVDAPKNDHDLYGLRYAEFVVPLVKSVQELSKLNEEKDQKINSLQKQIDELKELINDKKSPAATTEKISSAALGQNTPNPFNHSTSISFTLPANYSSARIVVTNTTGETLKELNVSGKGKGVLNLDTASLNAGMYQYALYVNGNFIDSKQMIVVK